MAAKRAYKISTEQRERLRERKRSWWAKLPEEKRNELNEKKSKTYWEVRKQVPLQTKNYTKQTLCWDCQRAVKECPWSANFEPVDGWDAEPTMIMTSYRPMPSYHVKACPLFEPDP